MGKLVGKCLDNRYHISELISIGGMAKVYKAFDKAKQSYAAVKVLKDEFSKNEEFVRRFKNESNATNNLIHPNIVRVYDVNFNKKINYIVMDYVDGITLKEYITEARVLNWKDVLHFTTQILIGLQHAHENGLVHRDVKPQNVLIGENGSVKVADFGNARFYYDEKISYGKTIGSVHYVSPEQARGDFTDAKSDIYSVGIMMYEMLTGKLPFDGDVPEQVAKMQIQKDATSILEINGDVPKGLVEIVEKAMRKEPTQRYVSVNAMLGDLLEFSRNPDVTFNYDYSKENSMKTKYFKVCSGDSQKQLSVFNSKKVVGRKSAAVTKKSRVIPILLGIACGVFFVAIIMVAVFIFGNRRSGSNEIELPNFVGLKISDVRRLDNGKYSTLRYSVEHKPSSEVAVGRIISQEPIAGIRVKSGCDVKLTVSSGQEERVVPSVVGMNVSNAQMTLNSVGFKNVRTISKPHEAVAPTFVIGTNPAAGVKVSVNTPINIVYSSGPVDGAGNEELVEVPNVVGKSLKSAEFILKSCGLEPAIISRPSDEFTNGTVMKQNKTQAKAGSTVEIIVSTGSETEKKLVENNGGAFRENISTPIEKVMTVPIHFSTNTNDVYVARIVNKDGKVMAEKEIYNGSGSIKFKHTGLNNEESVYDVTLTNRKTGNTTKHSEFVVKGGNYEFKR